MRTNLSSRFCYSSPLFIYHQILLKHRTRAVQSYPRFDYISVTAQCIGISENRIQGLKRLELGALTLNKLRLTTISRSFSCLTRQCCCNLAKITALRHLRLLMLCRSEISYANCEASDLVNVSIAGCYIFKNSKKLWRNK